MLSCCPQLFSVLVAIVGLASFALVLALVEQIVLEVIDSNVRRDSKVYEEGHTLVLGWCSRCVVWKGGSVGKGVCGGIG